MPQPGSDEQGSSDQAKTNDTGLGTTKAIAPAARPVWGKFQIGRNDEYETTQQKRGLKLVPGD